MKTCIVSNGSMTLNNILTIAILSKYLEINDVYHVTQNDDKTLSWIRNTYDSIYCIDISLINDIKCHYVQSINDAFEYIDNVYLDGINFLLKDVNNSNYFCNSIFKQFTIDIAIKIALELLDDYIIDTRNIKPVMFVNDIKLLPICFKNGAQICIKYDISKEFVIVLNKFSQNLQIDNNLYDEIKKLVPDNKLLNIRNNSISFGNQKVKISNDILKKCDYNERNIQQIAEEWLFNKG